MNESNLHYIKEIQREHTNLSPAARKHIHECDSCKIEYETMLHIQDGVRHMPRFAVPPELKLRVLKKILNPVYSFWHIMVSGILLLASPLFLRYMAGNVADFNLSQDMLIFLFALYGALLVLIILPVAFKLIQSYSEDIHDIERSLDDMLDHPAKSIAGVFRKKS